MKRRMMALATALLLGSPLLAMAQTYGSGGGYGSGGTYGSGTYGSGGDRFEGKIDNRFDVDYEVSEAYYEGWEAPGNSTIEGRLRLDGTWGELAPAYTPNELWYEWWAPGLRAAARGARVVRPAVSFSTRGSTTAEDYGCDTSLEVLLPITPEDLLGTGAYGVRWDEEASDYKSEILTEDNLHSAWDWVNLADGTYVDIWSMEGIWLVPVAHNEDEEYDIYEMGSLVTFYPDHALYLVHVRAYTPGEVRLAWHMDGTEADVATPVYRFYSKKYRGHFYTVDPVEKQNLIDTNPNWKYEMEAYAANPDGGGVLTPLYRFYSKKYRGHFFTIDPEERDDVILNNPNWKFEGIAYYVLKEPGEGTVPVYRFWSKGYKHHFYTMDENEKDDLIRTNPNWTYEKIAFYAIP